MKGNTMAHKLYIISRDFAKQMSRQNISAFSASTAFFLFLSCIPMLILICTLLPYTPLTEEMLVEVMMNLTPERMNSLIVSLVAQVYEKSVGTLSVAAVITLMSAGKGILALIRGLNSVNEVVENRNYFVLRIVASFYTVIVLIVVLLLLLTGVFGNVLVNLIVTNFPQVQLLFGFLMNFRFLFIWAVLTLAFTMIYTYIPNKKMKFTMQVPGACFSAIVWLVFSWGFSVYVDHYDGISAYGSLSILIVIMLWLYCGMYIIMIGAHLNRYFGPVYRLLFGRHRR